MSRTWKRLRPLFTVALLAIAVSIFLGSQSKSRGQPTGTVAPAFTLPDLRGTPTSLARFRGRPVLLNFWATWCPPCRAELPDLEAISGEHPHCLQVLGISEGDDSAAELSRFASQHELSYPILIDSGKVGSAYGVETIPHSVLLDAKGRAVRTFEGPIDPAALEHALTSLDAPGTC